MMSDLPEIRDLFHRLEPSPVRVGMDHGVRVGRDLGADIVVLDSGAVVAVTKSRPAVVNNSLPQYRESLLAVGAARDKLLDEPDAAGVVAELEVRLREIDDQAFDGGEYWALIVEQIRDQQF
jgi:hypothetical protein